MRYILLREGRQTYHGECKCAPAAALDPRELWGILRRLRAALLASLLV